jgi:hypothetical protein
MRDRGRRWVGAPRPRRRTSGERTPGVGGWAAARWSDVGHAFRLPRRGGGAGATPAPAGWRTLRSPPGATRGKTRSPTPPSARSGAAAEALDARPRPLPRCGARFSSACARTPGARAREPRGSARARARPWRSSSRSPSRPRRTPRSPGFHTRRTTPQRWSSVSDMLTAPADICSRSPSSAAAEGSPCEVEHRPHAPEGLAEAPVLDHVADRVGGQQLGLVLDLAPTTLAGRKWAMKDIAALWISMCRVCAHLHARLVAHRRGHELVAGGAHHLPGQHHRARSRWCSTPTRARSTASPSRSTAARPSACSAPTCPRCSAPSWPAAGSGSKRGSAAGRSTRSSRSSRPRWEPPLPMGLLGINAAQLACFFVFWGMNLYVIHRGHRVHSRAAEHQGPAAAVHGPRPAPGPTAPGGFGAMLATPSAFDVGQRQARASSGRSSSPPSPGWWASGPRSRSTSPTSPATRTRSATRCWAGHRAPHHHGALLVHRRRRHLGHAW